MMQFQHLLVLVSNMKHEIKINKLQIQWLREMFESYQALMDGAFDEDATNELEKVKKYALPVIEELERAYEHKNKANINPYGKRNKKD